MKILLAEDEPTFRALLEQLLTKWGYEAVVACNGDEAWSALQAADAPRLAILDWMMPGMDGVSLCRKIRERGNEPYVYILLLTAQQRDKDLVTGMEAGADDFLTKPFKLHELQMRLRAGMRIIEFQNELLAARRALQIKASQDSLTGLWNHEEILSILHRELARAEREEEQVSVIMADLDHFKEINDTHGHQSGDTVLRSISHRLLSLIRPYDSIGRYGGEEFLFVLPECSSEQAVSFAERLRNCISCESVRINRTSISITTSLGVATSNDDNLRNADALVGAADAALYQAKENGRNCVRVAPADDILDPTGERR